MTTKYTKQDLKFLGSLKIAVGEDGDAALPPPTLEAQLRMDLNATEAELATARETEHALIEAYQKRDAEAQAAEQTARTWRFFFCALPAGWIAARLVYAFWWSGQ